MLTSLLLFYYASLTFITFCLYGYDKHCAKRNKWRVKESKLHWCALLGGWFGALLGQKVFRHKTTKARFRRIFWLTLTLNIAMVLTLLMNVNFEPGCF